MRGGDGADVLAIERSSAQEFRLRLFMAIKALYARLAYDSLCCSRRAKRKVFTIAAFAERRAYSFRFHTRSCLACRNMSPAAHRPLELASIVVRNAGRVGRRAASPFRLRRKAKVTYLLLPRPRDRSSARMTFELALARLAEQVFSMQSPRSKALGFISGSRFPRSRSADFMRTETCCAACLATSIDQNTTSGRSARAGGGEPAKLADAVEHRPHLAAEREFRSGNQFADASNATTNYAQIRCTCCAGLARLPNARMRRLQHPSGGSGERRPEEG